jgi:hypothetical protein
MAVPLLSKLESFKKVTPSLVYAGRILQVGAVHRINILRMCVGNVAIIFHGAVVYNGRAKLVRKQVEHINNGNTERVDR